MIDSFHTIQDEAIGEFKDRGSKFIAYAYPITDVDQLMVKLYALRKEHLKACHFCFAFRLGIEGKQFRANDDGEPSGTAGKPILGQLIKYNITDTAVVVVRYFGGTKLGTSGLINAYKQSTIEVLNDCKIIEKIVADHFKLSFDYGHMGKVMETVKTLNWKITEKHFEATAYIVIGIRKSEVLEQFRIFKAKLLNKQLEEITDKTQVEFCSIEEVGG